MYGIQFPTHIGSINRYREKGVAWWPSLPDRTHTLRGGGPRQSKNSGGEESLRPGASLSQSREAIEGTHTRCEAHTTSWRSVTLLTFFLASFSPLYLTIFALSAKKRAGGQERAGKRERGGREGFARECAGSAIDHPRHHSAHRTRRGSYRRRQIRLTRRSIGG